MNVVNHLNIDNGAAMSELAAGRPEPLQLIPVVLF
jgi:hypothetical protein